jgi:hypothetical protein
MIGIENLKLYQMYLENQKQQHKTDVNKKATENLAEYVWIGLQLDRVSNMIEYLDDCCY